MTIRGPAWYRVAAWARQGQWATLCWGEHGHLSFERGDDFCQVDLERGRFVGAFFHRHDEIVTKTDDADEARQWLVKGP